MSNSTLDADHSSQVASLYVKHDSSFILPVPLAVIIGTDSNRTVACLVIHYVIYYVISAGIAFHAHTSFKVSQCAKLHFANIVHNINTLRMIVRRTGCRAATLQFVGLQLSFVYIVRSRIHTRRVLSR